MNRIKQGHALLAAAVATAGIILGGVVVSSAAAGAQSVATHSPAPARAAAAGSVSGSRTALVITVALNGATNLPTSSSIAANVIDASRPWFDEASRGVFGGYFALNRGPVTVQTTTDVCSGAWLKEIGDRANAAIMKQEPSLDMNGNGNLEEFGAVVYYFDKVDTCANANTYEPAGAAGWGDLPAQSNRVWLNGYSDLGTAVHELGHNLGLNHSGSESCTAGNGGQVPLSGTCVTVPYGDAYSSMGDHLSDSYSPSQLQQLGWNNAHVVTVTATGATTHYVLTAPEVNPAGATEAVRLVDGSTTLWLEYRRPLSQAGDSRNLYTEGLLVRREDPTAPTPTGGSGSPFLLLMNPTETFDSPFGRVTLWQPNMVVGQTWSDPLGTMQITLDSADETSAHLTIRPTPPVIISKVKVPNIQFLATADAQRAVTAAGLVTSTITTVQDRVCDDAGKVISQSPTAGTALSPGGHVDFVVATPVPGSNCTGPPVGE